MSQTLRRLPVSRQLFAQANTLLDAERLVEAESMVGGLLLRAPANSEAFNVFGVVALHGGRGESAIGILRQAAAAAPRATVPRINPGHALKATGWLAEAIESCRDEVRLKPRDAQGHYALGSGLLADGQFDSAEAALQEATRLPGLVAHSLQH